MTHSIPWERKQTQISHMSCSTGHLTNYSNGPMTFTVVFPFYRVNFCSFGLDLIFISCQQSKLFLMLNVCTSKLWRLTSVGLREGSSFTCRPMHSEIWTQFSLSSQLPNGFNNVPVRATDWRLYQTTGVSLPISALCSSNGMWLSDLYPLTWQDQNISKVSQDNPLKTMIMWELH